MLGEIITAGASIVGGIFGSKKKTEKSESVSTVDYKAMSDAAIAGGFNPLTAIRNGGTGGFVTTKTKGTSGGGGASIGAGIADAAGAIAPLFGSGMASKIDPIKVKNKTTGAVSPLVHKQLYGSAMRTGSVVVPTRQTTIRSPRSSSVDLSVANDQRRRAGTFVGPMMPRGAGDDGEIEDAMVAWRRSDGSIFYSYNPKFPDGDAAAAAAVTDGLNRGNDSFNSTFRFPSRRLPQSMLPSIPAQSGKVGRYRR